MREVPFMLFYRSASEVSAIQYRDCFPSILPTLEIELSAYHLTTSFFSNKLRNFLFVLFYENRERIRDLLSLCSSRLFQTDCTFRLFRKSFLSLKQIRKNRRWCRWFFISILRQRFFQNDRHFCIFLHKSNIGTLAFGNYWEKFTNRYLRPLGTLNIYLFIC